MLEKNIIFTLTEPSLSQVAEMPSPTIKNLPEWYKSTSPYMEGKKKYEGGAVNATIKKCVPVLDAIGSGYFIKTWTETHFQENEVTWSMSGSEIKAVEGHPIQQNPIYPFSSFYKKEIYKWINPWHIKTPKGYSTLFLTPIGYNLPFKIIEGIVDTDVFPLTINFPFLLNRNFEGVIPYNIPMVQVIPFKRDSFLSKKGNFNKEIYDKIKNFHDKTFFNKYKNNWWKRKSFK